MERFWHLIIRHTTLDEALLSSKGQMYHCGRAHPFLTVVLTPGLTLWLVDWRFGPLS